MSENMTDKQMEVILNLVADKFSNCKDMEEVAKAVQEVRNMAKKKSPVNRLQGQQKGRRTCQNRPIRYKSLYKDGGKMARTRTEEFNQIKYQNEFNKANYDRVEVNMPKGKKQL